MHGRARQLNSNINKTLVERLLNSMEKRNKWSWGLVAPNNLMERVEDMEMNLIAMWSLKLIRLLLLAN